MKNTWTDYVPGDVVRSRNPEPTANYLLLLIIGQHWTSFGLRIDVIIQWRCWCGWWLNDAMVMVSIFCSWYSLYFVLVMSHDDDSQICVLWQVNGTHPSETYVRHWQVLRLMASKPMWPAASFQDRSLSLHMWSLNHIWSLNKKMHPTKLLLRYLTHGLAAVWCSQRELLASSSNFLKGGGRNLHERSNKNRDLWLLWIPKLYLSTLMSAFIVFSTTDSTYTSQLFYVLLL